VQNKNLLGSSDRGSHAKRKDNKKDQKEQQENEDGERSNAAKRTIAALDRTPSSRKVVDLLELLLITECHAKRKGKQKGQRIRNATKTSVDDLPRQDNCNSAQLS
jgi:hypothetical protein